MYIFNKDAFINITDIFKYNVLKMIKHLDNNNNEKIF